jgi:ABC-2 type transport system permease protein
MLRAAWLIARREYLERVRSRAFLLTTIILPVVLAAVLGGKLLTGDEPRELRHLVIASPDQAMAREVEQALSARTLSAAVEVVAPAGEKDRTTLAQRLRAGQIDGFLWLQPKPEQPLPEATYSARTAPDSAIESSLEYAISEGAMREQLQVNGLSPAQANALEGPVNLRIEKLGGAAGVDRDHAAVATYLMVMMLYVVVIVYGMDVARSVVQEKTSRIFEVLLATAQPESLMLGKLLGVGAAGLTQVAVWCTLILLTSAPGIAARIGMGGLGSFGIGPLQIVFFILYFILGYLFYSAISAGVGATLGAEQEIQQFAFVIVAPMIISVLLMDRVQRSPNSALAVGLSLFPPSTPIMMYVRLCAQRPPAWQLALSILLMVAAIGAAVWLAARIYRVGILMHGKRATLPEMMRWLRYS